MVKTEVETLLSNLCHPDSKVRQRAAIQLGKIGDSRAVEPLINTLVDTDSAVVGAVAWALGRIGDEQAIAPLISRLDQKFVVHGLEQLGQNALLAVIEAVETTSGKKRMNAIQGIRQFTLQRHAWVRPTLKIYAVDSLVQALADEDENIRGYAITVLGDIGNTKALTHIMKLAHDSSDYVRWCVAKVLGRLGDRETIPMLEYMHNNDKGTVKVANPHGRHFVESIREVSAWSIQNIQTRTN